MCIYSFTYLLVSDEVFCKYNQQSTQYANTNYSLFVSVENTDYVSLITIITISIKSKRIVNLF